MTTPAGDGEVMGSGRKPLQQIADGPFTFCMGEMTAEERQHLLDIGHVWEDSEGVVHDIST
jgi:hypothetical protein